MKKIIQKIGWILLGFFELIVIGGLFIALSIGALILYGHYLQQGL